MSEPYTDDALRSLLAEAKGGGHITTGDGSLRGAVIRLCEELLNKRAPCEHRWVTEMEQHRESDGYSWFSAQWSDFAAPHRVFCRDCGIIASRASDVNEAIK